MGATRVGVSLMWWMALLVMGCGLNLPDGIGLTNDGRTVTVGADWRDCEVDSDCVAVSTSCDGCCAQSPLARERLGEWEEARSDACRRDFDSGCDCEFEERVPACREGRCWLLNPEDEEAE